VAKVPPPRQGRSLTDSAERQRHDERAAAHHDTPDDTDDGAELTIDDPGLSPPTLDEAVPNAPASRTQPSVPVRPADDSEPYSGPDSRPDSGPDTGSDSGPPSGQGSSSSSGGFWGSSASSASGERLFPDWERFEILDFVGAGGMGSVFKARDPRLQRLVAIKFMRDGQSQGLETRQRQRFQREAQAQARLDHPHICKIYGGCRISDGIA
jgi:hypothetical protein